MVVLLDVPGQRKKLQIQSVYLVDVLVFGCDGDDLAAAFVEFLDDAFVGVFGDAHGDSAEVAFFPGEVECGGREFGHLAVHSAQGETRGVGRPDHGRFGLFELAVNGFFQESCPGEEIEGLAHFGRRDFGIALLGDFAGGGARHERGELADDRVAPGIVELEEVSLQHADLVVLRDGEHAFVGGLLGGFFFGLAELDHGAEVFLLETGKTHGVGNALHAEAAELALAVADHLHVGRGAESRYLRELAPRKRGAPLAFLIVVQHVLAKIYVVNYRFHQ